jgi:hypothetical protein
MTLNRIVELQLKTDPAGIDVLAHAPILAPVGVEKEGVKSNYFDMLDQNICKTGL